eukprot:TRINITY_DN10465_c0_g2_i1.p1 TRINITY_DN10465_c0_g2~~TRINITY_DN10465_c0_g2_i1.p1  ORF type:complete len:369 (-),score=45.73 TRINITY_DN10465_c0_g2_i1:574-1575(-)
MGKFVYAFVQSLFIIAWNNYDYSDQPKWIATHLQRIGAGIQWSEPSRSKLQRGIFQGVEIFSMFLSFFASSFPLLLIAFPSVPAINSPPAVLVAKWAASIGLFILLLHNYLVPIKLAPSAPFDTTVNWMKETGLEEKGFFLSLDPLVQWIVCAARVVGKAASWLWRCVSREWLDLFGLLAAARVCYTTLFVQDVMKERVKGTVLAGAVWALLLGLLVRKGILLVKNWKQPSLGDRPLAEQLRSRLPPPGKETRDFIRLLQTRLRLQGGLYLAIVVIGFNILDFSAAKMFRGVNLGLTSMFIIVGSVMALMSSFDAYSQVRKQKEISQKFNIAA